ncbi:unnamed protein product [Linum trigynum]|uniref:Uncharacterized protein n=1 Tax=Linum trigynum TaxID=586398 RepID=A0AAV2E9W9_9ROSI
MKTAAVFSIMFLVSMLLPMVAPEDDSTSEQDVYIVYTGGANPANLAVKESLINRVLVRKNLFDMVTTYQHGLAGFAARMSSSEAMFISQQPGVLSVFKDSYLKPLTTRSWDFLGEPAPPFAGFEDIVPASSEVVIGFIDTGIWPESPSFLVGNGSRAPPADWKGICETAKDFNSSACNGKIVGARSYVHGSSARDIDGHGSHVASTAAGMAVKASYHGFAAGTARGGSESSRIAVYKACCCGCKSSAILKAFDDAISDGVRVISASIGSDETDDPIDPLDYLLKDPVMLGAFHAVERGITVVCAAGNRGPLPGTVLNDEPWTITVAAATIDRDFRANVLLGSGTIIKGEGIVFHRLNGSAIHPLTSGEAAKERKATNHAARDCQTGSLSLSRVEGKVVFCETRDKKTALDLQVYEVMNNGGLGIIIENDFLKRVANYYGGFNFAVTVISTKESLKLKDYLKSTKKPIAKILATVQIGNYKPAPEVAFFSSAGPSASSVNIVKPDITAPGDGGGHSRRVVERRKFHRGQR